ncbi:MAG: response regulator, partial [Caldilineaceae bacterium]|nr:response regulator [Caldilineaceae bacterium]
GLVLTYRMAEIHGGSITVESRPGEGSTFTIALPWRKLSDNRETASSKALQNSVPIHEMPQAEPIEKSLPPVTVLRPSLLVVDKQVAARAWVEELIARRNPPAAYDILPASTAADALRLAHEVHPQLIFVELKLGGNEGVTLIRTLAADPQLRNTPIVAWTALSLPGEEAQARAAGAHIYLCKPLSADILHELLAQISESFVAVHTVKMLTKKPKTVS